MTPLRIGIQGVRGAFHDIAARRYFAERPITVVPADTFEQLIALAQQPKATHSVLMAIENSIYGSILPNYELIRESGLHVGGEVFLRIQQNLLTLPHASIADLRAVYSHPVAIAQCADFFRQHPHIQLIEADDTAASAALVQSRQDPTLGAIASTLAADYYGLEVAAAGIETHHQNYTRFLHLVRQPLPALDAHTKFSVSFTLQHQVGSLHHILAHLARHAANLTMIQSVPILGAPWQYRFYIDCIAPQPQPLLDWLAQHTTDFHLLGRYAIGAHH